MYDTISSPTRIDDISSGKISNGTSGYINIKRHISPMSTSSNHADEYVATDNEITEEDSEGDLHYNDRRILDNDYDDNDNDLDGINASKFVQTKYQAYKIAGVALIIALASFTIQTETTQYIQNELKWKKPFLMLYLTHSSWILMAPLQFAFIRLITPRRVSTKELFTSHVDSIKATARNIHSELGINAIQNVFIYFVVVSCILVLILTTAAITWYLSLALTTPSDVTALYNCSTFFAYVFSIPILGDHFRKDKMAAVLVSIAGAFLITYGDSKTQESGEDKSNMRLLGNLIIAIGAVFYGMYEVLYKKYACPASEVSPYTSLQFSNIMASMIGGCTLLLVWIPIPLLHVFGLERLEWPTAEGFLVLLLSIICNVAFTASFLSMVSLTSPVLSSVGAMYVQTSFSPPSL